MARLQLIFPLLMWTLWRNAQTEQGWRPIDPWLGTAGYGLSLLFIVALLTWTARRTMRRTTYEHYGAVPRFHRAAFFARWLVLALHAGALWGLGYGNVVLRIVPDFGGRFDSLPAFASLLPVIGTWVGLMWAQYPLDRGVREQNALYAFELGEAVHAVPDRATYLLHAFRSQVLFTLSPLIAIAITRDALTAGAYAAGWGDRINVDLFATLIAVGVVFSLTPELLRRILPTQPLPASPLRTRLEQLAKRLRLGVRDILLWRTHHTMGNAAVMGVLPGVRYVLITDLLIESMTEDQLEAVFAHEAGHVVHRHIAWYIAFFVLATLGFSVIGNVIGHWILDRDLASRDVTEVILEITGIAAALILFGALSRRFERQADLFAARRLDRAPDRDQPGRDGTLVFISALRQVARLNNLPLDSRSMTIGRPLLGRIVGRLVHHASTWLHGSIQSRINHLGRLKDEPAAARRFDRAMLGVRFVLLVALAVSAWSFARDGK